MCLGEVIKVCGIYTVFAFIVTMALEATVDLIFEHMNCSQYERAKIIIHYVEVALIWIGILILVVQLIRYLLS